MNKLFIILMIPALFSCGKQKSGSVKLVEVSQESYSKFINQKDMPADPNINLDKSIVNAKYPIEIALYANGKFYYNLPRLSEGTGTWKFKGSDKGKIQLFAKQFLFDMNIDIYATEENAENLAIQFTDRFGINTLKMDNTKIE